MPPVLGRRVYTECMSKVPIPAVFTATPYVLKDWLILPVPEAESLKLPSRGQVSVSGTVNGHDIQVVLEPDGRWGHWFRVDEALQRVADIHAEQAVEVALMVSSEWPEPAVPADVASALEHAPEKVQHKWRDITPMARWEWIRWVNSTGSDTTRAVRIEKTISKLNGTHRRPCCFNLAACTEPYVAKGGRLMER